MIEMEGNKPSMKSIKPMFMTWEKIGQTVEGMLVAVDTVTIDNYPVAKYIVETDNGRVGFLGTVQLVEQLSTVRLGTYVEVEYVGEVKSGRSRTVKEFNVRVEVGAELASDPIGVEAATLQE